MSVDGQPVDDCRNETGSGMIEPHSLNGRLLPVAIDAFSSLSVTIWNGSSAPRGPAASTKLVETDAVEAAVAGDDAAQPLFVGRLDQLVHQLRTGDVTNPAVLRYPSRSTGDFSWCRRSST
jgi:hypothetical protein